MRRELGNGVVHQSHNTVLCYIRAVRSTIQWFKSHLYHPSIRVVYYGDEIWTIGLPNGRLGCAQHLPRFDGTEGLYFLGVFSAVVPPSMFMWSDLVLMGVPNGEADTLGNTKTILERWVLEEAKKMARTQRHTRAVLVEPFYPYCACIGQSKHQLWSKSLLLGPLHVQCSRTSKKWSALLA